MDLRARDSQDCESLGAASSLNWNRVQAAGKGGGTNFCNFEIYEQSRKSNTLRKMHAIKVSLYISGLNESQLQVGLIALHTVDGCCYFSAFRT